MKIIICAACLLLAATACAPGKVPPAKTAALYFQEGESFFERGLYEDAIASWEKVRDSYYSSELNALAELKIADAHFLAEHYLEAAGAYEDFLKQHPGHEKSPQITFQLGLAYQKQMLTADRDQTAARNAVSTFDSLVKRYPDAPQAAEARRLAALARDRLAAHELYVGRFYLRYGHPQAAVRRLQAIFTAYPSFLEMDKVYFFLGQAHLKSGNRSDAVTAFNTLYRKFPDSEHVAAAQRILAKTY